MVESLIYDTKENYEENFQHLPNMQSFTFGNGLQKTSMEYVNGPVWFGSGQLELGLAVMDNHVPILFGINILADAKGTILDCGRGFIGIPLADQQRFISARSWAAATWRST